MNTSTMKLIAPALVIVALLGCGGATSGGNIVDGDFEGGAVIRPLTSDTDNANDTDDGQEEQETTCYQDVDGDRFGSKTVIMVKGFTCGDEPGVTANDYDCDDSRADVHPGAPEIDDGVDNNCRDGIDEGLDEDSVSCRIDSDRDGFGRSGTVVIAGTDCDDTSGYVDVSGELDCDDGTRAINPDATEVCNDLDDDCDGDVDEGCDQDRTYYRDADSDGYGNPNDTVRDSTRPAGYVTDNGDCDDGDDERNPGLTEVCDDKDNDCDGDVDEGCPGEDVEFCDIEVTYNAPSSISLDSVGSWTDFNAEVYAQVFDGSAVVHNTYWPTGQWDSRSQGSMLELIAVTEGQTRSGTIESVPASFDFVKLNGGMWTSSTWRRWIVHNDSDVVAGTFSAQVRCDGDTSWDSMSCVVIGNETEGYDHRCNR